MFSTFWRDEREFTPEKPRGERGGREKLNMVLILAGGAVNSSGEG
jgi:hypothetical protein